MKTPQLTVIAIALVLLAGCGSKPRVTAEKFLKDCAAQNFADAKQYTTVEAGQQLDMLSGMAEMFKGLSNGQNTPEFKFIFVREEINGDHAVVTYRPTENAEEKSLPLQKIDGKWLVSTQ